MRSYDLVEQTDATGPPGSKKLGAQGKLVWYCGLRMLPFAVRRAKPEEPELKQCILFLLERVL